LTYPSFVLLSVQHLITLELELALELDPHG
jgi:hypothetical protein